MNRDSGGGLGGVLGGGAGAGTDGHSPVVIVGHREASTELEGFRARVLAASAVEIKSSSVCGRSPRWRCSSSATASQRAEKVGRETSEKSQGDRDGEGGGVVLATSGQICEIRLGGTSDLALAPWSACSASRLVTTNGDKLVESMTPALRPLPFPVSTPLCRYSRISRFPRPPATTCHVINFRREGRHGSVEGNSFGPGEANCHAKRGLGRCNSAARQKAASSRAAHRHTTASRAPDSA